MAGIIGKGNTVSIFILDKLLLLKGLISFTLQEFKSTNFILLFQVLYLWNRR